MTDFTIRPATTADISTLIRHRRNMWWDMGRRDEAALLLMHQAASDYFTAAVPDGSYRGFLALDATGNPIGGGGIARALLETMIAWCHENDFASVGLHASDAGRPLYEQLGFKPTTEMRLSLR